jgi:hypothetical protein
VVVLGAGARANIRTFKRLGLLLGGAVIVLLPVIAWNAQAGRISASTSNYLGWQVLIGTNQVHDGRYNTDDLMYLADPWPIAVARVKDDPVGFAGLVVRKEVFTWTDETYAPFWTVGVASPWFGALVNLGVLGLVAVFARALLSLRQLGPAGWTSLAIIGAFATAYAFTESQGRYHFYFLPLFLILSTGLQRRPPVNE